MMTVFNITGTPGAVWPGAAVADPLCYTVADHSSAQTVVTAEASCAASPPPPPPPPPDYLPAVIALSVLLFLAFVGLCVLSYLRSVLCVQVAYHRVAHRVGTRWGCVALQARQVRPSRRL